MSLRPDLRNLLSVPALVLALGLTAAACGTDDTTADSAADSDPSAEESTGGTGDEATDSDTAASEGAGTVLSTVSGGQIDFGSLEGTDTVLWYWAPW